MENLWQLTLVWAGAFSFALLFRIERHKLLPASLGGLLAWGAYLLAGRVSAEEVTRYFLAAVALTIYGEVMARVMKCPATVFIVVAAIPLIPGRYLYNTMEYFLARDYAEAIHAGQFALLLSAALATGMLFPMSVFQLIRRTRALISGHLKI